MGEVIGLVSLKGGVGKTTLSAALAAELANRHGKKVLLIDANYSAPNLGIHMDIISPDKTVHDVLFGDRMSAAIHTSYGVDVVPGNFLFDREFSPMKLKSKLTYAKRVYDFIILDASPTLNEEVLSTINASDRIFLVTTADYPSLSCAMKISKFIKQRKKEADGIIVNRISKGGHVSLEEIQESTGLPVIATIKEDAKVAMSLLGRVPANLSKGKFSREVERLGNAMVGRKAKKNFFTKALSIDLKKQEVNRELLRQSFYTSVFKS